ncbi:MAG TPA: adenylate kinase [Pirellulaceae bacterium]
MLLVLLGPPGVGKGTQCRMLVERFDWQVISTGEILRRAMREGTSLGQKAREFVDQGQLLPDGIMIELVRDALPLSTIRKGCLLDGFPRTIPQAEDLAVWLKSLPAQLDAVIVLMVDDSELRRRMLQRAVEEGRSDDTSDAIAVRLETYHRQTAPLIEYYRAQGILHEVSGLGTPAEVQKRIVECIP